LQLPDEFGLGGGPRAACGAYTVPRSLWGWPTTSVQRRLSRW